MEGEQKIRINKSKMIKEIVQNRYAEYLPSLLGFYGRKFKMLYLHRFYCKFGYLWENDK